MPDSEDDLTKEFLAAGKSFFSWNSGKNTPNILLTLTEQLGAVEKKMGESIDKLDAQLGNLEGTIKESSDTSSKLAGSLNKITGIYVILTGVIAIATALQVWLALRPTEPAPTDSAAVSKLVDERLTEREADLVAELNPKMQAIYSDMLRDYSPPPDTPKTFLELFAPAVGIVSEMSTGTEHPAQNPNTERRGADQPATAPESTPEGDENPKPESEGRSR